MRLWSDDRGVTVQVGAVLLLGFVVVMLSMYQAQVVPEQNRDVEFAHNQQVHGALQEVRNALVRTGATGSSQPVGVPLGTRYAERVLFVNPPAPAGALRTAATGPVTIEGATAADREARDYLNASGGAYNFSTQRLSYRPNYNVYATAPTTVYENGVVYNRFSNAAVTLTGQQLVRGDRVTVVTLAGNLSTAESGTVSLDPQPVSTSVEETLVDGPFTVTVPTDLSASEWADLLATQPNVSAVTPAGDGRVAVSLNAGTYRLRMARVGVGADVGDTDAHYVTNVSGGGGTVVEGTSRNLVVEVRDRYNNPVANARVNATASAGGLDGDGTYRTDARGRVTLAYDAPDAVSGTTDVTVNVTVASDPANVDPRARTDLQFSLAVTDGGGGGGAVTAGTLFDSSFENGGAQPPEWTFSSSGSPGVSGSVSESGQYAGYVGGSGGSDITTEALDASESGYLDVEFWVQEGEGGGGPEPGDPNEHLLVEFLAENGTWVGVERINVTGDYGTTYSRRLLVTDPGAFHSAFKLRFRQPEATGSDEWFVDDVRIFGVGSGGSGSGGGGDGGGDGDGGTGGTVLFDTGFENGSLAADGWSHDDISGTSEAGVDQATANSGSSSAYHSSGEGAIVSPTADTGGGDSLQLEYWVQKGDDDFSENPDAGTGEDMIIEFLAANGSWVELDRIEDTVAAGAQFDRNLTVTDPGAFHSGFQVRFHQEGGSTQPGDFWHVDDVKLTEFSSGSGGGGGGGSLPQPQIDVRLDDLSLTDQNRVQYVASYDVSNANSSFERVSVEFDNVGRGPSATGVNNSTATRGNRRYSLNYAADETWNITARVIYSQNGNEYVAASESIEDTADAVTPGGNADLGTAGSPTLTSTTVDDRSNPGQGPRYRLSYQTAGGNYSKTELATISLGDGDASYETRTAASATVDLNPGYGLNTEFAVKFLVFDGQGAVVDVVEVTDIADGTDP